MRKTERKRELPENRGQTDENNGVKMGADMTSDDGMKRRSAIAGMGTFGAASLLNAEITAAGAGADAGEKMHLSGIGKEIHDKVFTTPFIDTHEHLFEEWERMPDAPEDKRRGFDWTYLFTGYLASDMLTAGMPPEDHKKFFSREIDSADKWRYLEPYWPAIKNTGYGKAVALAVRELYGVEEIGSSSIRRIHEGFERMVKPGFYKRILREMGNIESCQVNSLEGRPFMESAMPEFLMQDISILGMANGPAFEEAGSPTGIEVKSLADWHRAIEWWFEKYARFAVAVKSQQAYLRDIDFRRTPAEEVEKIFERTLRGQEPTAAERKALEDHCFWHAVGAATEAGLPVKLHTGYYAGQDRMPLSRLIKNPGSATDICREAPDTRFVFMHICYPYYEELIAVAKQYTNAYIDMCWSWIINPVAAKDFLKKYLVTAPANKIVTFGGDYGAVEPVLGHAIVARRGIALAISELVEEGWYSMDDALTACDMVMHDNARRIFNLNEKAKALAAVPWR